MIKELEYIIGIDVSWRKGALPGFLIVGEHSSKLDILQELNYTDDRDYILESIGNMHEVMKKGYYMHTYKQATRRLPNGSWDRTSYIDVTEKKNFAEINSGEGCGVDLYQDKCIVHNLYDKKKIEVDATSFYEMMKDWEKAIIRWKEERIEMMKEEKKKAYFREYLEKMYLNSLESMLKREREIIAEEAERRGMSEKELEELLRTNVLEELYKLVRAEELKDPEEKERNRKKYLKEKGELLDRYLGDYAK